MKLKVFLTESWEKYKQFSPGDGYVAGFTFVSAIISLIAPIRLCHYIFPLAQYITGEWILWNMTAIICTIVVFLLDCAVTYGFLLLLRIRHKWPFYLVTSILIFLWVGFYCVVARLMVLESGVGW